MSKSTVNRVSTVIVVMLLLIFAALPSVHADGGVGVISGKVLNKTGNGGPVSGVEVTLRTIEHQSEGASQTATTDKDGAYRFEKLVATTTTAYLVGANYLGVDYGSDLLIFNPDETTRTADISVYETTDKADAISIDRAHVILDVNPDDQILPVMEILVVTNASDRTFVPSQPTKGTLHVSIPASAKNLQLEPQLADSAIAVSDGFVYAGAIQPGSNQLMYAYDLPYSGGTFDLTRTFDYSIQQLSFLMPEKGIKATSKVLEAQDSVQLTDQGPKYLHLLGNSVAAASPVIVHLEGLPTPSPIDAIVKPLRNLPIVADVAIAVVVIGAIALVVLRRRRGKGNGAKLETDPTEDDEEFVDDDALADEYADDDETVDEGKLVSPPH